MNTTGTTTSPTDLLAQIFAPANRADPYPLYSELRKTPVARLTDGTYVVSTYAEIVALLHDPRISSAVAPGQDADISQPASESGPPELPPLFLGTDPPLHDRLRAQAMRPFGPPNSPDRVVGMRPRLAEVTTRLIDGFAGKDRIDIVDELAYPLPVTAICDLLGVPHEDEPLFHAWSQHLIDALDPNAGTLEERTSRRDQAEAELGQYLNGLADTHSLRPGDSLISGLLTDTGPHGRMSRGELVSTAVLLLVAGHETTVNLIANGTLTLLRNPDVLNRLRDDPGLVVPLVEELLRFEPPVQFLGNRTVLADIDIAGTTIPAGSPLMLMLAAGNRDPHHFGDPDRFDPTRTDNQHLGFGSGIHVCYGAALARAEAQIALVELAQRLENPRLVTDPPPYRVNPVLRGPRHLLVEVDAVAASTTTSGDRS